MAFRLNILNFGALYFTPQMMLLALIPSVFLLLLKQCVYEVYEMDPETSGVTGYLLLICVVLTSNIARAPPIPFPIYQRASI